MLVSKTWRLAQRWLAGCAALLGLTLSAAAASAETLQAPFGGRAIPLGSRVACTPVSGGWSVASGGRTIRPPEAASAVGTLTKLKVAADAGGCTSSRETIQLAVVGPTPVAEPASVTFFRDEARVDLRGRRLKNAVLVWRSTTKSGSTACRFSKAEPGAELCSFELGRGLATDPRALTLTLLPEGGRAGDDVVTFDGAGKSVNPASLLLVPARVVLARLVPPDAAVDLATGRGEVALARPDVITGVDCAPARCEISAGSLLVRGLSSETDSVDVKVQLASGVFLQVGERLEPQPTLRLAVLHCPMSVVSGPPLRDTASARTVIRLEGRCGHDPSTLRFEVAGQPRQVLASEADPSGVDLLLAVGNTDADAIKITVAAKTDPSVVVGAVETETRSPPEVHATVGIPGRANLDFIPNNRPAIVHTRRPEGVGHLVVLPVDGVYRALDETQQTVRGEEDAAGLAALRFAFRVPTLPGALADADLAVLSDPVQRSIHAANLPAPLGQFAPRGQALVELVCGAESSAIVIAAGATRHLPYEMRDDCRVEFHRERLSPSYGTQELKVVVDVLSPDGASRGDGHVAETLLLRPGTRPLYSWIHGVASPFDRVVVRVSHVADHAHYIGAAEVDSGAAGAKWTLILGTGLLRLYATSTIPTGLYRFGDKTHSGALSLNFGIVSRLTWLDSEGHEGLVGLEAGIMTFGLTADKSTTGESLTQVGLVTGLGVGVPIANRSSATEASINLHAWFERDVSRVSGRGFAFIFGPSISIGNVGTNL